MSAAAPQQSWPDEVRSMVDALMHGGACPHVEQQLLSWIVSTGYAHSGFNEQTGWWLDGRRMSAAVVLAELLQRSDTVAPAQTLSNRILVAVPTARTVTTDDGIEVTVGSKSVRWKREKNGWSLGDDLFTSDDRVIEHARSMAADAAAETQWKLATDLAARLKAKGIETCTVRNLDTGVVTVSAESTLGCWHSAELRDGRWHYSGAEIATTAEAYRVLLEAAAPPKTAASPSLLERLREAVPGLRWEMRGNAAEGSDASHRRLVSANPRKRLLCWAKNPSEPLAVDIPCPSDDECVRIVTEWYAKTHPAPAAPQPSSRALDTDAALRAAGQRTEEFLDTLNEDPAAAAEAAMKLARTVTADVRSAFSRVFGNEQGERIVALLEARKYSEATKIIEALTKELEAKQTAAKGPTTMTTQTKTEALTQTIKLDASEAAWRTAGSQFVKLAREPLVGLLTRHLAPSDDAFRARLAAFLETELGTALLASMLSATLSAMPQTTGEVPQKLARELRVKAMADAGDVMADVLMGPLRQVMALYLQDAPGAPAAAPALDAPQAKGVEWATAEQKEGAR